MSTAGDVATEIQRRLTGIAGKERLNSLDGALTTATTEVILNYPPSTIDAGTLLSVDYELMHVWHANDRTLSVQRAMHGTTAVNHSDDALVEIEPRWPKGVILKEMQRELQSLPKSIYKVASADITIASDTNVTDFTGMSGVEIHRLLSVKLWDPSTPGDGIRTVSCQLVRDLPAATFASGYGIQIPDGARTGQSLSLRVTYATDLTTSTVASDTNLVTTVGLPVTAEDILVYGVASRLMMDHEAQRNDLARQGQQRHAEEVPPQSWIRTAQFYKAMRDERVQQEAARLLERYGYTSR